jgi:hypothetical protein
MAEGVLRSGGLALCGRGAGAFLGIASVGGKASGA